MGRIEEIPVQRVPGSSSSLTLISAGEQIKEQPLEVLEAFKNPLSTETDSQMKNSAIVKKGAWISRWR